MDAQLGRHGQHLFTLRGAWDKVRQDPVLKFFVVAVTDYGMSTFEGPMMSIKSVIAVSHFTDWTVGHVHAGTLGWNAFMAFGILYWIVPRLWKTTLYSTKLVTAHFWIATIGMILYQVSMWVAGITQWLMWQTGLMGQLMYPPFAAFPGPMAPPTPNVPMPLIAFASPGEVGLSPAMLKTTMIANLGDPTVIRD